MSNALLIDDTIDYVLYTSDFQTYLSHYANKHWQNICEKKLGEEIFISIYGFKCLNHSIGPCCCELLHDNRKEFHWCEFTHDSKDLHMAG